MLHIIKTVASALFRVWSRVQPAPLYWPVVRAGLSPQLSSF